MRQCQPGMNTPVFFCVFAGGTRGCSPVKQLGAVSTSQVLPGTHQLSSPMQPCHKFIRKLVIHTTFALVVFSPTHFVNMPKSKMDHETETPQKKGDKLTID